MTRLTLAALLIALVLATIKLLTVIGDKPETVIEATHAAVLECAPVQNPCPASCARLIDRRQMT